MPSRRSTRPTVVLAIGGHDPSSGAGITAYINTIAAHQCYGLSCVTALTVQSTTGVRAVEPLDPVTVREVLSELARDANIRAIKVGMLATADLVREVADFLGSCPSAKVVLDPVLKASSGKDLLSAEGTEELMRRLLPLAYVITPNIDEAWTLAGSHLEHVEEMHEVASRLHSMGAKNVVITGGHLVRPVDLVSPHRGRAALIKGRKVQTSSTHGTGCAYSTALACNLALGKDLLAYAKAAKRFVEAGLRRRLQIGRGRGPVI